MTPLKIYPFRRGFIIHTKEDNGHFRYLWQDGTLNTDNWSQAKLGEKGYYRTKQEAENFLKEYLMSQTKNEVQKRIEAAEKELEAAKLELKNLDRNLPSYGYVGQVYSFGTSLFMMTALGPEAVGFTVVSGCEGCYDSSFIGKHFSTNKEAFEYMKNNTNAKYIGRFSEIFERKNNE